MGEPRFDADASTPAARRALHEQNRLSWDAATRAHNSHKADQARFHREGGNTLYPEEIELLGDLRGQAVVHLQCNSGQDTLSLRRLGPANVLGVDISEEAIAYARKLSADSGVEASFIRSDVYDWLADAATAGERWDVVFCSYGAITWLSDLSGWGRGVASILRAGRRFVAIDYHPIALMFDPDLRLSASYSTHGRPTTWEDGVGDYVAQSRPAIAPPGWMEGVEDFENPHASHEFHWGTADVIGALLAAGLVLEHFHEYDYCNGYRPYQRMKELSGPRWTMPDGMPDLPLMYSVAARKPV